MLRRLGREGAHHEKTKALIHKRWRQFNSDDFCRVMFFWYFALLSLSTAKANYNLSEKSVKAVSNYYAADTKAEEIYSQIRQVICRMV